MYDYAMIMNVFQEDIEYYINKFKATEVTKDECKAIDYGLEKNAKENGYKFKRVKFIITTLFKEIITH